MNKQKTLTCLVSLLLPAVALALAAPRELTIGEGFINPFGYHNPRQAFSWKLPEGTRKQMAYHVQVFEGDALRWDSAWVESDQSVFVPYGGTPLVSRQRLQWRVRFRDAHGNDSEWSQLASMEMGLLSAEDWQARWIRPVADPWAHARDKVENERNLFNFPEEIYEPVAYLQRQFVVDKIIERARLYVTARGVFEVEINGIRLGQDYFANGWTAYDQRLDTVSYDVTEQLQADLNTLDVKLGTGWYAGSITWRHLRALFGRKPELLLQLEIFYRDGSAQTIVTDANWRATHEGPIRSSSFFEGERYDARQGLTNWQPVAVNKEMGSAKLSPKPFLPVRVTDKLPGQEITEPQPGRFVFDLGQNMVGWARLKVPMEKDQTLTIRFAEMLNPDGSLYTENYRRARSTNYYTAAQSGIIEWEPTFTFHGFRYVELSGLPENAQPQTDWVTGIVLHTDMRQIGTFESSHPQLNQLQRSIVWGQRGNFLDIPSDCPQRDERLGWTGDAQIFCATSLFNYDCHAFWKSWLHSMRQEQFDDGRIPHIVPDVMRGTNSPGWMDAATIVPWEVYVRTGDIELLADNYPMMKKLAAWYRGQFGRRFPPALRGYGDWLQPYAESRRGDTPHSLIGVAFYANSLRILTDTARLLGEDSDARKYAAEAAALKQAFGRYFFNRNGKLTNAVETQSAYVLALEFELVPDALRERAVGNLLRLVDEAGGHLRTGFLGTPHLTRVLDREGHTQAAYDLLFKDTYPSWFFTLNQGATTMWERWNSYSHAEGFGDASMNSFNHYAYGAIGRWMYERVAGLKPDPQHPGYKHFFIAPAIGQQLEWVKVELETPYGRAVSGWKKKDNKLIMEVTVPPNTTATVIFPNARAPEKVMPGNHVFEIEWLE